MNRKEVKKVLDNVAESADASSAINLLVNLVENLVARIDVLESSLQESKNEINRLKGEQGKPNIRKQSNNDDENNGNTDRSSERDRKNRGNKPPRKPKSKKNDTMRHSSIKLPDRSHCVGFMEGRLRYILGLLYVLLQRLQIGKLLQKVSYELAKEMITALALDRVRKFDLPKSEEALLKVIVMHGTGSVSELAKLTHRNRVFISRVVNKLLRDKLLVVKQQGTKRISELGCQDRILRNKKLAGHHFSKLQIP